MKYILAFDIYGTLINTSGVFDALQKMIGAHAKPFMETWRDKQLEYSFRRGLMNKYEDFSTCTKNSLEFCCAMFKTNLTKKQIDFLMAEYSTLPPFTDIEDALKCLKAKGHKLYAFSNGSESAVVKLLNNAKIIDCFNGIISVESTKTFKPNPLVYAHFNKATKSSKSNSWLISSNAFDVIGAISYGMRSVWLQRSKNSIFDPWGIEPTITISKLTELSSKLNALEY